MQTEFPTQPSYRTQREQFLAAATAAGATLTEYPHPSRGRSARPWAPMWRCSAILAPSAC